MVALSVVIFAPMLHVGCLSAICGVTDLSCSAVYPLNGPPLAVIISRLNGARLFRPRHCHMAECSLSTGSISTPARSASGMTQSPPHTRVSLLARARVLPALIAASEYFSPAKPPAATSTTSAVFQAAAASAASSPPANAVHAGISVTLRAAAPSARAAYSGFIAAT